jgi:hypothetical protein
MTMRWKKIREAQQYCGNISRRLLYDAVAAGQLRVARIGTGRNFLTSEEWLDQWLQSLADRDHDNARRAAASIEPIEPAHAMARGGRARR